MPRYNLSPREMRAQQQDTSAQQDQQDTQQQTAMLQQLASLMGIQQEQQLAPEKLRALRAENAAREYANTQNPVEDAARTRLLGAQAGQIEKTNPNMLTPAMIAHWHEVTGKPLAPELMPYAPEEYKQYFAQQAAGQKQQQMLAQDADARQQGKVGPDFIGPPAPPALLKQKTGSFMDNLYLDHMLKKSFWLDNFSKSNPNKKMKKEPLPEPIYPNHFDFQH